MPAAKTAATASSHATGTVTLTFTLPHSASAAHARRPLYVSPATTEIAVALKSINGAPAPAGNAQVFRTSDICNGSTCTATLTLQTGDDVVGVLAYTDALATRPGNVPLSFAEGEILVGGGSQSWSGDPIDQTGHLYISLFPVVDGGQVTLSADNLHDMQCSCYGLSLAEFEDGANDIIPNQAYGALAAPYFANTPMLVDSDASGATYLRDDTTATQGATVEISSPADIVDFVNAQNEAAGTTITATVTFHSATPAATFVIPPYFGIGGSVSANDTIPPPFSSTPLTFHCNSSSPECS